MRHSVFAVFLALSSMISVNALAANEGGEGLMRFDGMTMLFLKKDDIKHPPIKLEHNPKYDTKSPAGNEKSVLESTYSQLFYNVIDNDYARCVFYEEKKLKGTDESVPPAIDVYEGKSWVFNKFEPMPQYWKSPGVMPVSFSMRSQGKVLKVMCAAKNHVVNIPRFDSRAALASYNLLLSENGILMREKNGRDFNFPVGSNTYISSTEEVNAPAGYAPATPPPPLPANMR